MRKVHTIGQLESRIEELEALREVQKEELKVEFRNVAHQLSPAVLIRNGIQNIVNTPGLKSTATDTAISSGAGFLGRKLLVNGSKNVFMKLAGSAAQFVITNLVRNKLPGMRKNRKTAGSEPAE